MTTTTSLPDDCVQTYVDPWWVKCTEGAPTRGRLIRGFVPHVQQVPFKLTPEARKEPTEHRSGLYKVEPLRIGAPRRAARLPVAALPEIAGEERGVYRVKTRPLLVVGLGGSDVPAPLKAGTTWQTSPTLLVAPYYGTDESDKRAGWLPALVDRIRRAEYPQYVWDRLPIPGRTDSILRLDHIQPIGKHGNAFELTGFRLSDAALDILDEWITWVMTDALPDGDQFQLAALRSGIAALP